MKNFTEMTDIEMLDRYGLGSFDAKDVKNPELFGQENTDLVTEGFRYTLVEDSEETGCFTIGTVTRNGKRYTITVDYA